MNIKDFLEKYGKEKSIKIGEYMFKHDENDTNLYYIDDGSVMLSIFGQNIALVGKDEIIGEKSFLENSPKPIDAIAKTNTKFLYITKEEFENIKINEKIKFLKELVLAISSRVYLLNDIITNLSKINQKVSAKELELSLDYFQNTFKEIMNIKNAYLYKFIHDSLSPIFESKINIELQEKIKKLYKSKDTIKQFKNRILVKAGDYIVILEGEKLKNDYIINNVLIHSLNTIKYMCLLLDEKRNEELSNMLDEEF